MLENNCKNEQCNLKGFWTIEESDGGVVACFRIRHHGEKHIQTFTPDALRELAEFLENESEVVKVG